MNPRTRSLEVRVVSIDKMTLAECVETFERSLCLYRWLVFPSFNPSKAPRKFGASERTVRRAIKLALASTLEDLAKRLRDEAKKGV